MGSPEQLWTDAELDQLQDWLGKIDIESAFVRGMRGERAFLLTFESVVRHPIRSPRQFGDIGPRGRRAYPIGWALRGFGAISLAYQEAIEESDHERSFGKKVARFYSVMNRLQDGFYLLKTTVSGTQVADN
jgi:hypothetical protein